MKRIIIASLTIITAVSAAAYTTRATWTDTVSVSNNQIQTGTADLQVSTDSGSTWSTSTKASSMVISGLIPGGSDNKYSFSLWNASSPGLNFGITGEITAATGIGEVDQSKLELAVYEEGATPGDTGTNSSAWVSLSDWQSAYRSFNSVVVPGTENKKHYRIAARLLSSADNTWQGKTLNLTLTVLGTQP